MIEVPRASSEDTDVPGCAAINRGRGSRRDDGDEFRRVARNHETVRDLMTIIVEFPNRRQSDSSPLARLRVSSRDVEK